MMHFKAVHVMTYLTHEGITFQDGHSIAAEHTSVLNHYLTLFLSQYGDLQVLLAHVFGDSTKEYQM